MDGSTRAEIITTGHGVENDIHHSREQHIARARVSCGQHQDMSIRYTPGQKQSSDRLTVGGLQGANEKHGIWRCIGKRFPGRYTAR